MAVTPDVGKSKKTYRGLKEKIGGAMKTLVRIKDESEMTRFQSKMKSKVTRLR